MSRRKVPLPQPGCGLRLGRMDHVWDNYKYPNKPLVTFCQVKVIQGHEVKEVKLKILALGVVIHVLCQIFGKVQHMTPELLLNASNSTKY